METTITLACHIPTGTIVHISEAANGLSCNCNCFECGERFEAIQGTLRTWHFRHNVNKDCEGGQESALHQLAKEIIKRNKSIALTQDLRFDYHAATLEKGYGAYRADVAVVNSEGELFIEIAVKHFLEKSKEEYFKSNSISSIEIDLSKVDRQIKPEELELLLLNEIANKRRIYPTPIEPITKVPEKDDSWIGALTLGVVGFFGIRYICRKLLK